MTSDGCVVLSPSSAPQGMELVNGSSNNTTTARRMKTDEESNTTSSECNDAPVATHSMPQAPSSSVSSMSVSASRNVSTDSDTNTDCSGRSAEEARNSSTATLRRSGAVCSSSTEEQDESKTNGPLDQQLAEEDDEDFEAALTVHRNKRVLVDRLFDTAPRGRLSQINLSRRELNIEDTKLLKQAIITNKLLSVLKLSYNSLGDEGASIIASAISNGDGSHHENLSVLDLGFNSIGDEGCKALAVNGFAGNYQLRTIYLSGNRIGELGAVSIAGAILHGTGLSRLHLFANRIGPNGLKAIAGAMTNNDSQAETAAAVGMIHSPSTCASGIEELHLGCTSITTEGFVAIPGILLLNTSLRSLSISDNGVDDNAMVLLSQALSQNKNVPLESLQLSFNEITCQGVEYLMNAVWGSPTLKELKLDNNRIKDRGAQLCAVAMPSIPFEVLDLSMNRLTTVGIKALMKNLSENSSMRSLGLSGIPIDQNASKAVSYAMAYNSSLETLHVDNCSAGYAAQRHMIAGIVSNRRSSLRLLTGFHVAPIAKTLGMPGIPEHWANDRALGFFRLMWRQWLLKSGRGSVNRDAEATRGPAPPAAVAAAAKIALSSFGKATENTFRFDDDERPITEGPPIDPLDTAIIERAESGEEHVPSFAEAPDAHVYDWVEDATKSTKALETGSPAKAVGGPLNNAEMRNRNLQWLRVHFRSLNDIRRLTFNNAHLWQLHQYYFSPPYPTEEDGKADCEGNGKESSPSGSPPELSAPPPTPSLMSKGSPMGRAVSFQTLGDALASSDAITLGTPMLGAHKRRSETEKDVEGNDGPAAKRAKSLKPRIARYPRIMAQIQSLGTRPMDNTLMLLRQLKYTESIMFAGIKDPYADDVKGKDSMTADIEMILLDLL